MSNELPPPTGYATHNGMRSLQQDDATVLLYPHDYLIRPDQVPLYTADQLREYGRASVPEGCVPVPLPLLKSALQALEKSIGYVEHDYETNWRHDLPSRQGQLNAMLIELTNHRDAIRLLKEWIEPGDSNDA